MYVAIFYIIHKFLHIEALVLEAMEFSHAPLTVTITYVNYYYIYRWIIMNPSSYIVRLMGIILLQEMAQSRNINIHIIIHMTKPLVAEISIKNRQLCVSNK